MVGMSALLAGSVRLERPALALEGAFALFVAGGGRGRALRRLSARGSALALFAAAAVPYLVLLGRGTFHGPRPRRGRPRHGLRSPRSAGLFVRELPAIAVIVAGSVGMVYTAVLVADREGLPRPLVGLLLLATLTSLPNAATAIRLGLRGRGEALVSETLNSNTINLSMGILVPAALVGIGEGANGLGLDYAWMAAVTVGTLALVGRRGGAGRAAGRSDRRRLPRLRRRPGRHGLTLGGPHQPVAGPGLGDQVRGMARIGLDLPPQLRDVDVQVVRLDLVGGAPHLAQDRPVREQLALVAHEEGEQVELDPARPAPARRRRVTRCRSKSTTRPPTVIDSPPVGRGAAHGRAQPGQELAHPERLGDVVVGAGVERLDLLPSSPTAERITIGHLAPRAQLAAHVDARAVGQHQVEHDGVGRPRGRRGQRLLARRRPHDLVARRRAGWWSARAGSAARRRRPGSAAARSRRRLVGGREREREAAPWPGRDSAQRRPPFASAKPARDREAEAGAGLVLRRRAAVERLEHVLELVLGQAAALVDHAHDHLLARAGDAHA